MTKLPVISASDLLTRQGWEIAEKLQIALSAQMRAQFFWDNPEIKRLEFNLSWSGTLEYAAKRYALALIEFDSIEAVKAIAKRIEYQVPPWSTFWDFLLDDFCLGDESDPNVTADLTVEDFTHQLEDWQEVLLGGEILEGDHPKDWERPEDLRGEMIQRTLELNLCVAELQDACLQISKAVLAHDKPRTGGADA